MSSGCHNSHNLGLSNAEAIASGQDWLPMTSLEIKQKTIMIESGSLIEIFRTEQISFNTHSKRGCEIAIVKTA